MSTSHGLGVVRYPPAPIGVIYRGQIGGAAPGGDFFEPPYHPYTEALLSAIPIPDPDVVQKRVRLEGELPSVINPPKGCRFATRCPRKIGDICDNEPPPDVEVAPGHRIKCHIPLEELRAVEPIFQKKAAVAE